jgi:hypothetical protein
LASIDRLTIASVCVGDTPYVDYEIEVSNTSATTATITFSDLDGNLVLERSGLPLAGRLLYPGASLTPADWPGWRLVDGMWVADPTDARWRDGLDVVVQVNPTATAEVSYPPATAACNSPTVVDPPGEAELLGQVDPTTTTASPTTTVANRSGVGLPSTGAGSPDRTALVASMIALAGAGLTLLTRRSRSSQS